MCVLSIKPNLVDRSWQFFVVVVDFDEMKTDDYTYEFELSCRCDSFDWMAFLHVHTNKTCANLFLSSSLARFSEILTMENA